MFSRVLLRSLPQSVVAPWRAVLTVWANIPRFSVDPFVLDSRSFAPFRFPARPCGEASHAASRQVFLDAVAHGSVISLAAYHLLREYDFSYEKLRDNVGIRPPKLTP